MMPSPEIPVFKTRSAGPAIRFPGGVTGFTILIVGILAACSSAGASAVASASAPAAAQIQPVLVSTQAWPGPNRILLTVEDAANQPLTGPDLAVRATFRELGGGAGGAVINAVGSFVRVVQGGRGLIQLDVDFPRPGTWRLDVEATPADGVPRGGTTELEVRPDGATPAIGSAAPRFDTPTVRDVGGDFARITSDPIPEKSLYRLSVRAALDAKRPFVLVLDSYGFKESQSCGGALGLVRHLGESFPTVSFINVEPYRTTFSTGRLTLDPPNEPGHLAAWSQAWGIDAAPWVFVVDGDGIVRAKFSGILGTEELRAALRSVAGWTPTADGAPSGVAAWVACSVVARSMGG
jgi:hypothetical protein